MLKYEKITTDQATAALCDRCGLEMPKRGCDGEWDERISIAFRGGYHSIFGDGNAVELDLCQHCLKEVLGQWIRITDDGWPKSLPHHAGQDSQRSIHPDRAFALQDFERGDNAESPPPRPRGFPSISGPIDGPKEFFQRHEDGKKHE